MNTLHLAIQQRNITKKEAARQIGITRQTLYTALNDKPVGKKAASLIKDWLNGAVSIADLMHIKE